VNTASSILVRTHSPVKTNGGRTAATPPPDRQFTAATRLQFEKELLGFLHLGHPNERLSGLAEAIIPFRKISCANCPTAANSGLCGMPSAITKKLSKKDNRPWAAFTLATKRLSLPMNMFSEAYEAMRTTSSPRRPCSSRAMCSPEPTGSPQR